jgi:hypothetical protein
LLAANAEMEKGGTVLLSDNDKYLMTPCAVDKWIVIQVG